MASDKIITVIVPSYNMEKYLPKCLGSMVVAPELMEKLEVLVVNDGSKDRTSEIAHEFEAKYPQTFKVIDKPNGNYGSCINAALLQVAGKYVRILDADDFYNTDEFESFLRDVSLRIDSGIDVFVTNFYHVSDSEAIVRLNDYQLSAGIQSIESLSGEGWVGLHALTYRTDLLRMIDYRQTEGVSYTDLEWDFLPMLAARTYEYLPRNVYSYRLGRDGQTMNEATYAKNFDVVIRITSRLIHEFSQVEHPIDFGPLKYAYSFLKSRLSYVYQLVLLNSAYSKHCELLKGLDAEVQDLLCEYSSELSSRRVSRRFPLRYINYWRTHGNSSSLLRIARCYVKVLELLR